MKKTILLALTATLLLCLPLSAYAQESESTTAAIAESTTAATVEATTPSGDAPTADIPDFLRQENNFIMDSYDISGEIREYMGVDEGDQIVRILKSSGFMDSWFVDGQPITEDFVASLVGGTTRPIYAVRHADGSITQTELTKDHQVVDGNIADLPDAIWTFDTIRKIDPDIKVEKACILHYPQASLGELPRVILIFYRTDLGDYVYYRQPPNGYKETMPGEYLFPYETFCGIQKELYDKLRALNPTGKLNIGSIDSSITQTSVDLSPYDIHSAAFHIDVPERPHTGLYIALGIGGGLILAAAVTIPLVIRARKRRIGD